MKKYLLVAAFAASIISCKSTQVVRPEKVVDKLGQNPYFIIDGQAADNSVLQATKPEDVASLTTYYGKEAITKYGEQAKDGAVEVETKPYSKAKYQQFFKEVSSEYKVKLAAEGSDDNFQYILNGKVLTKDFEGTLAGITPALLKEIKVIGGEEVASKFHVSGKSTGILITALPPKNLYHAKEKYNQK